MNTYQNEQKRGIYSSHEVRDKEINNLIRIYTFIFNVKNKKRKHHFNVEFHLL